MRISVLLCIEADGKKLPPFLVFKGEKEKIKEKKLQAYSKSKGNKVYISCQENAWCNAEIFLKWLKIIFFNNRVISNSINKIVIMDRATSHYHHDLVKLFKENNSRYLLIPPGLTPFIQPLDVSINDLLKKNYIIGTLILK